MAKRYEQTYHVKLQSDPKEILSALKQIQANMANLTTNQQIFDGLKKEFDKLTLLANNFKAEIESGVKSPNDFTRMTSMANNLEVGLNRVVESITEIAKNENKSFKFSNIEQAEKELQSLQDKVNKFKQSIETSQTNVAPMLQNLKMTEEQATSMAQNVKSQEQLVKALEEEWEKRKQIYEEQKQIQENDNLTQRAVDQIKEDTNRSKYVVSRAITSQNKGSHYTNADTAYQDINNKIQNTMVSGLINNLDFDTIVTSIDYMIQQLGVTLEDFDRNSLHDKLLQTFNRFHQTTEEIEQNVINTQQAMEAIGTTDASGRLSLSDNAAGAVSNFTVVDADLNQMNELNNSITTINQQIQQMDQTNNLDNFVQATEQAQDSIRNFGESTRESISTEQQLAQENERISETFDNLKRNVKQFLSITNAWQQFRTVLNQTYEDVKSLDKAFGSIAMVTDKTVGELWGSYDDYAQMANELGQSTKDVIASSALYYQQGLDTAEALELTDSTMKLATLSGADFAQSTEQMTAA